MTENRYSSIGSIIGLIALGIAVFHFFLGPIEKQPTLEEYVANKAISIKSAISAKMKGEEVVSSQKDNKVDADDIVAYSVASLGFIAIVFGVIAFLKKEEIKNCGVSITLGAAAIAFKVAIAIAGALIIISLIGAFLGG